MKSTTEISGEGHRERLRQRFLSCEEEARNDELLLELLLTYAIPRKDVQPLAKSLISEFGSLNGVLSASTDKLCSMKGIGNTSAALIKLVDRLSLSRKQDGGPICSGEEKRDGQLTFLDSMEGPKPRTSEPEMASISGEREVAKSQKIQDIFQPKGRLFSITGLAEAIELLPRISDTENLEEVKSFLRDNLHFNSERTRRDYAAYIVKRIFPNDTADKPFREFSARYIGTQNIQDICFYRFAKSEPLTIDIVLELLLPAIGAGKLSRDHIRAFLEGRFGSENRNIRNCIPVIVKTLTVSGIAVPDRTNLRFAYRDIDIPAFAFIVHSEFPTPGMYDIQKIESNRSTKAMLWNPNRILPSLYELRNMGLINKISEIDSVRQFTTKYTLEKLVERLISRDMNSESGGNN